MPAVPLPFIAVLLLLILFLRLCWQKERVKPAICFTALCILMMLCTGVRWSTSWHAVSIIQPLLAVSLPLLVRRCFAHSRSTLLFWRQTMMITGAAALLSCLPWCEFSVDQFIALTTVGVGLDLLYRAKKGNILLSSASSGKTMTVQRVAGVAGGILCFSGSIDLLIAIDYALLHGHHAALIVASAQVITLPAIALSIALVGKDTPIKLMQSSSKLSPPSGEEEIGEDESICQHVTRLIIDQALWRDPDLTLDRLARKARIPARKISRAINRIQRRNVSQMLNSYRITEAQRQLVESSLSITEIMLDTGFRTKSNFNHEFLKLSGCNPGDYRRTHAKTLAGQPLHTVAPSTGNR